MERKLLFRVWRTQNIARWRDQGMQPSPIPASVTLKRLTRFRLWEARAQVKVLRYDTLEVPRPQPCVPIWLKDLRLVSSLQVAY